MTRDDAGLSPRPGDGTRAIGRGQCPSPEVLARAAQGQLARNERATMADHLASCADCVEELRALAPLDAWAERSAAALGGAVLPAGTGSGRAHAVPFWQYATVAAAVGAVVWLGFANVALRRENRDLMARSAPLDHSAAPSPPVSVPSGAAPTPAPAVDPRVAASPAAMEPGRAPLVAESHVNVPIVDVQPDALRGDTSPPLATVATGTSLVTLILNSDARDASVPYVLDVVDANGRRQWRGEDLRMTPYHTFTVALPPRAFAPGDYRLELSRMNGDKRQQVETYRLRVAPGPAGRNP